MNLNPHGIVVSKPYISEFVRLPSLMSAPARAATTTIRSTTPTQIYEALFCIATFIYLMYAYFKKNLVFKKPGMMLGVFLIVIFGSRIMIEFLKRPQVDFENNMILDMGQWLSIPFVIAGFWLCLRKQKNVTE